MVYSNGLNRSKMMTNRSNRNTIWIL